MLLENIGFYTLSNKRALNVHNNPLNRCELIVTNHCNFNCTYCRGLRDDIDCEIETIDALTTLRYWCDNGLVNVRFSGGEPTLYKDLDILVAYCAKRGVKRIAISTNGSADFEKYEYLHNLGVNDFSISLDSACCAVANTISGTVDMLDTVVDNIKRISQLTYTTIGMVFTEDNIDDAINTVKFSSSLGASDIRIIPSAQYNEALTKLVELPTELLLKHPILKYRIENIKNGRNVRGVDNDYKCHLVLDDMVVANNYHFPCVVYMREYGDPIGKVGPHMMQERCNWFEQHVPAKDPICSKMCLDVCVDYNGVAAEGCKICK